MSEKIKPYQDAMCIECGKKIRLDDKYEWAKRTRAMGGGVIYIHTECYQSLLKSKKSAHNK